MGKRSTWTAKDPDLLRALAASGAPTVGNYRVGPQAHLVKVTSQNGPFDKKWYAVGLSRIRYAEAAVCALPEIKPTDVVAALRKLTPVEIAAIGVGHRQIVLLDQWKGRPSTRHGYGYS
jgi:hypothetical protein